MDLEQRVENLEHCLANHIRHTDEQLKVGANQFRALLESSENTNRTLSTLQSNTEDIVRIYHDLQGVARIGVVVQKFGLWIIKWPLIGAGCLAIAKWISTHFGT